MKKYIQNLQEKSYSEKSNFAFVTSLVLTGVIATIWFLTIFSNFDTYFKTQPDETQNLANTGGLFDVFKEGLK